MANFPKIWVKASPFTADFDFLVLWHFIIFCVSILSPAVNDKNSMIIYAMKLQGTKDQYERLDNAIRTGRFVRNSVIRAWIDGEVKSRNDAYKYCKILAEILEFHWAKQLNSMARQAHALKSLGGD